MLNRMRMWLRSIFFRRQLEREMREEMEQHLARSADRLIARGMSRMAAIETARREFGQIERIREDARDARGGGWIDSAVGDIRYAFRHFRRTPLAAATIVLVLSLGIGSNIALFTLFHSMATQPPPGVGRDDSLVRIRGLGTSVSGRLVDRELSYPEVLAYERRTDLFDNVVAWTTDGVVLDAGDAEQIGVLDGVAVFVTGDYFRVLGVRPVIGPGLPVLSDTDDSDAAHVAVISHSFWMAQYGGSDAALGRTVKVNATELTIVGVARPRFLGVDGYREDRTVWLPLGLYPRVRASGRAAFTSRDSTYLNAVARLAPGIEPFEARAVVDVIAKRNAPPVPARGQRAPTADVAPLLAGNQRPQPGGGPLGETQPLGGPALLILLITCANAAMLLIGIATARRREIAVRISLGAARRRIVRQLLTESILLGLAAGGLGLLLTAVFVRSGSAMLPAAEVVVEWPALVFAVVFATGTGVLFGLAPALHATRLAVGEVLKDSAAAVSRSRSKLQPGLVVGQIALTQPLLVGLVAMILAIGAELRGMPRLETADNVLQVDFATLHGNATIEERQAMMERVRDRLAATPGILGAVPHQDGYGVGMAAVYPADRTGASPVKSFRIRRETTPPGHFALLGIPILRGRDFLEIEGRGPSQSIIIGSDLAESLWGAADPVGMRLLTGQSASLVNDRYGNQIGSGSADSTTLVVVGIVDERLVGAAEEGTTLRVFTPRGVRITRSMLVRTAGPASAMIPAIRAAVANEAPDLPITGAATLAALDDSLRNTVTIWSVLAASGGLLAVFLAAIGLYAVVALAVGVRTREIGIRTALGADRRRVVLTYFTRGLRLCLFGLVLGLPVSLFALRLFLAETGVLGVTTSVVTALVAGVVLAVAALAVWLPARRAARVDPLVALRAE